MKFNIIDAFTSDLFGGNPAGVVIIPNGSDFPSNETMINTAAELRYSETVFIKILENNHFNLRYFTPISEVDLCGHATIAGFYSLLKAGIIEPNNTYINETLAGSLEVTVTEDSILMDMGDPIIYDSIEDIKNLYSIMGIDYKNQGLCDFNKDIFFIPKKVSTGLIDIILPVKDELELDKINPDMDILKEFSRKNGVVGVHAFTINSTDSKIHARNFAPLYDIDEEAATGTSNGALTYYLYDYGILKEGIIYTIVQGEKMKRPSQIETTIVNLNGKIKIKVGGMAVSLAEGEINI